MNTYKQKQEHLQTINSTHNVQAARLSNAWLKLFFLPLVVIVPNESTFAAACTDTPINPLSNLLECRNLSDKDAFNSCVNFAEQYGYTPGSGFCLNVSHNGLRAYQGGNFCTSGPGVSCDSKKLYLSYFMFCGEGMKYSDVLNKCIPTINVHKPTVCTPGQGNPIYPLTGNKQETIHLGLSLAGKSFQVLFDSSTTLLRSPTEVRDSWMPAIEWGAADSANPANLAGDFGKLWSSSWHMRLWRSPNNLNMQALRGQGKVSSFAFIGNAWVSDQPSTDSLIAVPTGYLYKDSVGLSQELYDSSGLLQSWQQASGMKLSATYSNGRLQRLTDAFGRHIEFTYTTLAAGDVAVNSITDLAGQPLTFVYDAKGNLVSLTWPDGQVRTYVYDSTHAGQDWALTGVIDENSKRRSSFTYAPSGWAESTEYAGGVHRFQASYTSPPQRTIREVLDIQAEVFYRYHEWQVPVGAKVSQPDGMTSLGFGATAVQGLSSVQGSVRSTGVSQPAGAGCAGSSSDITYDNVTGNVLSRDDFNGKRVCYGYDSINREGTRIEGLNGGGSGTACASALDASNVATLAPEARKISTEWHPDWKLETRRAEPGKITTWVYNGQPDPFNGGTIASCTSPMYGATSVDPLPDGKPIAVLCKQVIQSTTDVNGSQGFAATLQTQDPALSWPQVTSRTTSYTYNQFGQVLTSTDERGQVTTNTYYTATTANYTKGDLWKVTNALGHVTEYTQYNPHGQVLQLLDPNGVATSYTYDLRQRLKSVNQAGQLTQIDWWPTGLLKKVTQPDGSFLAYTYDDAHRLTDIVDNLGNAVHYELDNAGNRKKEQVKDSPGVLTRQIDRNYDALNRLWKTSTGAPM